LIGSKIAAAIMALYYSPVPENQLSEKEVVVFYFAIRAFEWQKLLSGLKQIKII
jgi:hypothetical protein